MIPKIKTIKPIENYKLIVTFDSGQKVLYDVQDDIDTLEDFEPLKSVYGLFNQVQLDTSRTIIYWNDRIDLPSDIILEYGESV